MINNKNVHSMSVTDFLHRKVKKSSIEDRWHFLPWELDSMNEKQFGKAFVLLIHNSKYINLRNQRKELFNKVLELQDDPKSTPSRLRGSLIAIKEHDKKIADIVLENLARYAYDNGTKNLMKLDECQNSLDKSNPEQASLITEHKNIYRRLGFKIDSIDSDIVDLCSLMNKINPNVCFHGADGVKIVLEQLRSFIECTNESLTSIEEKNLYNDTADSISAYIDKRIKTFTKRLEAIKKKQSKKK